MAARVVGRRNGSRIPCDEAGDDGGGGDDRNKSFIRPTSYSCGDEVDERQAVAGGKSNSRRRTTVEPGTQAKRRRRVVATENGTSDESLRCAPAAAAADDGNDESAAREHIRRIREQYGTLARVDEMILQTFSAVTETLAMEICSDADHFLYEVRFANFAVALRRFLSRRCACGCVMTIHCEMKPYRSLPNIILFIT